MYDLIVRRAKIEGKTGLWDVGCRKEKIEKISRKIKEKAKLEIDAKGKLTTPTFVEPHIHLDKILISEVVRENKSGTLTEAIEIIWEKKKKYTTDDIVKRAEKVIKMGIKNGVTVFRTHADVDTICGLKAIEGLIALKEKYKKYVDIQIVAFPQEGIIKDPGTDKLMEDALRLGCDVVGGMPWNEYTLDDSKAHIDFCFSLAKKFDADIDMHTDETDTPKAVTLEYLAAKTIKEKYFGRVTADHTCAFSSYDPYYAAKIVDMVKRARMNMITNPATNLMLEGRLDLEPIRRGITRVKELLKAGVNVCYGQDCIKDTFYPHFGQEDPLEIGWLLAHVAQFTLKEELEELKRMPTYNAAKTLRLKEYGLKEGCEASFNIIDTDNMINAFRFRPPRLYVIKRGKILAKTEEKTHLLI